MAPTMMTGVAAFEQTWKLIDTVPFVHALAYFETNLGRRAVLVRSERLFPPVVVWADSYPKVCLVNKVGSTVTGRVYLEILAIQDLGLIGTDQCAHATIGLVGIDGFFLWFNLFTLYLAPRV